MCEEKEEEQKKSLTEGTASVVAQENSREKKNPQYRLSVSCRK